MHEKKNTCVIKFCIISSLLSWLVTLFNTSRNVCPSIKTVQPCCVCANISGISLRFVEVDVLKIYYFTKIFINLFKILLKFWLFFIFNYFFSKKFKKKYNSKNLWVLSIWRRNDFTDFWYLRKYEYIHFFSNYYYE